MSRAAKIGLIGIVVGMTLNHAELPAQDCVDFTTSMHQIGSETSYTNIRGVVLANDYAFVTDWEAMTSNSRFLVYDIGLPGQPELVFDEAIGGYARGIVKIGDYVVIADGAAGLLVYDAGTAEAPVYETSIDTPGTAMWLTVYEGDKVALADFDGLWLGDFSDPANPQELSMFSTAGAAQHVTVVGTLAFVAVYDQGLEIIDIADPEEPFRVGLIDVPGNYAVDACVVDDLAFVVDVYGTCTIVDVGDPATPTLRGSLDIEPYCASTYANDGMIFVGSSGLSTVDFSDPDTPVLMGYLPSTNVEGMAFTSTHAFLGGVGDGLLVVEINDGRTAMTLAAEAVNGNPWEIATADGLAVLGSNSPNSLELVNIGDPLSPTYLGGLGLADWPEDLALNGDYAYVAAGNTGLLVVDISAPGTPTLANTVATGAYARSSALHGGKLYLGLDGSIAVYDLADPALPALSGSSSAPAYVYGLGADGNILAAACGNAGMRIYDIGVPDTPIEAGSYDDLNSWREATVVGDFAYFSVGNSWDDTALMIFDISNPLTPILSSNTPLPSQYGGESVVLLENHAYFLAVGTGYHVLDVADPGTPEILGTVSEDWAMALAISDQQVFMAASLNDLVVGPQQCLYTPVSLASFQATALPGGVDLSWETSAGFEPRFRLEAVAGGKIRELPYLETQPGHYRASDRDPSLAMGGEVSYRLFGREAGESWQFLRGQSLELAPVEPSSRIEAAWPNPFNPHCTLRFNLAKAGPARVELLDLAGRRVRILAERGFTAGSHELIWNGRDEAGRPAATGVYFVRLLSAEGLDSHKLVLLR